MTLCDPFAINFLASSAIKIINHQVTNEALPRENAILHLLLRMMGLGLSAWDMIDTQEFMEPKLNTGLITQFVPSLMSLVVDDQIRSLNAKLPADEHESALTIIDHTGPPPESYRGFIEQNTVATTLAMHYTIQVLVIKLSNRFLYYTHYGLKATVFPTCSNT
jgi:negative elongation factor B